MKHSYAVASAFLVLVFVGYLSSPFVTSVVTKVNELASVNSAVTNVFAVSPPSVSITLPNTLAPLNNTVTVSLPGYTGKGGVDWPVWYITNTAPWNTIVYHYGKGQPNGYGPGVIQWTTNLSGYAPGTYVDTITLTSPTAGSISFTDTVQLTGNASADSGATTQTQVPPTVTVSQPTQTTSPTQTTTNPTLTTSGPVAGFGVFTLATTSVYDEVSGSNPTFSNGVQVFLPRSSGSSWPAWYITNTAPWDVINYHYGKGQPNGYGPGTIQWSTNLSGYAPGTYTDTLTLSSAGFQPVNLTFTVKLLTNGTVAPITTTQSVVPPPVVVTPPVTTPPPPAPTSTPATTTPAQIVAQGNLPAHPRVWMTPTRITSLKADMVANTADWQRVKTAADNELKVSTADISTLPLLCETYLATGDARYATRAGSILSAYAVPANDETGDSGYNYRFDLPVITAGLDWCYNGLTTAQHHQVATWLMDRADWVWTDTNPSRTGAWAVTDPGNNYWWGFMQTGPAALAAAGDDTGTGAISGSNRPAYHEALALSKWTNVGLPYLNTLGAGGAFSEGTNYDSTWMVARFADAFQTAGTPLTADYFTQALQWRIASAMPDWSHKVPFGDQARVSDAPLFSYDRDAVLDLLDVAHPSATLASEAQDWLNRVGQIPTSEIGNTMSLSDELLRFTPSAPAALDLSAFPNGYEAPGAGFYVYHQNWTDPNATVFALESGPLTEGHTALDANGFVIWKGNYWVSGNANIFSNSGIEQDTKDYNNMTIGGKGQSHNNGGSIVSTQTTPSLVVVRAQAKDAYFPPGSHLGDKSSITDYLRTLAYLPQQDTFVVTDRVTAVDPTAQKVFYWQTQGVPVIKGNTFVLSNPSNTEQCLGTVLLPQNAVLGSVAYNLGTGGSVSSHAVTVSLPTGQASAVVVTSIQCGAKAPASGGVSATSDGTTVTANVPGAQVLIPLNENELVTSSAKPLAVAGSAASLMASVLQAVQTIAVQIKKAL